MSNKTDDARARSWNPAIAAALCGEQPRMQGQYLRLRPSGSLSVHAKNGHWHDFAADVGGITAISLIRHLRPGIDAAAWLAGFLNAHPGFGDADAATDEVERDEHGGALCRAFMAGAVPIVPDDDVGKYLARRGLQPPYPTCMKRLPNSRVGEDALLTELTAFGRVIGVQLTHLAAGGTKSLETPVKQRFNGEKGPIPGAFMAIEPLIGNPSLPLLLCEGAENGLSLRIIHDGQIFAVPGVGSIGHVQVPKGRLVSVFKDGDAEDSPARNALIKGIDGLLLQGALVKVVPTPPNADANSLLQTGGPEALKALLAKAEEATLSFDGRCRKLAAMLPGEAFERERVEIAREFRVRRGAVDALVRKYRGTSATDTTTRAAADTDTEDEDATFLADPIPYPLPVSLCDLLDETARCFRRHVSMPESYADTCALWVGHTYVCPQFRISPRLGFGSPTFRCGKTTTLYLLEQMCRRALSAENVSAAAVYRIVAQYGAGTLTLLLDEFDSYGPDNEAIRGVLNSGYARNGHVLRVVETPDGYTTVPFPTYTPVCWASIGFDKVPATVKDRSLLLQLERRQPGDKIVNAYTPKARDACAQLRAKWAR
jgi:hypothetical protein